MAEALDEPVVAALDAPVAGVLDVPVVTVFVPVATKVFEAGLLGSIEQLGAQPAPNH